MKENTISKEQFEELTKRFVKILDEASEEKQKEIIENIPIQELKEELKKIYKIK